MMFTFFTRNVHTYIYIYEGIWYDGICTTHVGKHIQSLSLVHSGELQVVDVI